MERVINPRLTMQLEQIDAHFAYERQELDETYKPLIEDTRLAINQDPAFVRKVADESLLYHRTQKKTGFFYQRFGKKRDETRIKVLRQQIEAFKEPVRELEQEYKTHTANMNRRHTAQKAATIERFNKSSLSPTIEQARPKRQSR